MESVLVFLKPDAVIRRYIGSRTIKEFLDAGFRITYIGEVSPSREFIAAKHYAQHRGRFFYDWLVDYVTSSPLIVLILTADNVIYEVRTLLGYTIPEEADCNSIRGKYGILGGINVAHASDNGVNSKRELDIWKNIIKIQKNHDYVEETNVYVLKYLDFPMVDVTRYREISTQLINEEIGKNTAKHLFINLLSKESDFGHETLSKFADIMVKNAFVRKIEQ